MNLDEAVIKLSEQETKNCIALWVCDDASSSKLVQKSDDALCALLNCSGCKMVHCFWGDTDVYLSSAE